MARDNLPVTAAIRVLREHAVTYVARPYDYEPKGGTAHSAESLGVDEHIGRKAIKPCTPDVADRHSGYQVGGTSPFGLRRAMPVYMEASILELPRIYLNGGRRGLLVEIDPKDAARVLAPELVNVAIE